MNKTVNLIENFNQDLNVFLNLYYDEINYIKITQCIKLNQYYYEDIYDVKAVNKEDHRIVKSKKFYINFTVGVNLKTYNWVLSNKNKIRKTWFELKSVDDINQLKHPKYEKISIIKHGDVIWLSPRLDISNDDYIALQLAIEWVENNNQ